MCDLLVACGNYCIPRQHIEPDAGIIYDMDSYQIKFRNLCIKVHRGPT